MKKIIVAAALLLLWTLPAVACPMCNEAVSGDPSRARLTQGFARSIYLMMGAPYLLFGGITFMIVRSARRTALRRRENAPL